MQAISCCRKLRVALIVIYTRPECHALYLTRSRRSFICGVRFRTGRQIRLSPIVADIIIYLRHRNLKVRRVASDTLRNLCQHVTRKSRPPVGAISR